MPKKKPDRREAKQMRGDDLECSFCGKPRTECFVLITGPKVAICGDCAKDAYACLLDALQNRVEKPVELRLPPAPPPSSCGLPNCDRNADRIAKLEETTENLKVRLEALEEEERSR